MKKLCFIFTLFCGIFTAWAQPKSNDINFLADHQLLVQKWVENPAVMAHFQTYERQLWQQIEHRRKAPMTDTLINGKRIIPVVFHIFHTNGVENISEEQIRSSIELLNIDYAMLNSDTVAGVNTYTAFNSRRANPNIEFRIATIDPEGNPTDGIIRHETDVAHNFSYTNMSTYAWNPKSYLNVFSVGNITIDSPIAQEGTVIGMSLFPPSNPLTSMFTTDTLCDGVLIRHDAIGNIGTAENLAGKGINAQNRSFTHELGHYFNLYHPFQNLNENTTNQIDLALQALSDGCASSSMFGTQLFGDYVDDTPPVTAASSNEGNDCWTVGERNTCTNNVTGYGDEPDMVENYMDYQWGFCTNLFTIGQIERLNATMEGPRRKLWSYENLIATGVLNATDIRTQVADNQQVSIFPNPCNDILHIIYEDVEMGAATVELYDIAGKVLKTSNLANETALDLSSIPAGIYFVKISANQQSITKKIIKQ